MVALTRLAREYGNGAMLISELAKSEKLPQRFLENILLELKKWGYWVANLESREAIIFYGNRRMSIWLKLSVILKGQSLYYPVCLRKPTNPVSFAKMKQPVTSGKFLRKSGITRLKSWKMSRLKS